MKIAYVCNSPIPSSSVASSIQVMKMCQALARDHAREVRLTFRPGATQAGGHCGNRWGWLFAPDGTRQSGNAGPEELRQTIVDPAIAALRGA